MEADESQKFKSVEGDARNDINWTDGCLDLLKLLSHYPTLLVVLSCQIISLSFPCTKNMQILAFRIIILS